MSTLKADSVIASSGVNTDLALTGKGTGVPDLETGFKVNGTSFLASANSWTKAQRGAIVVLADGATITPDMDDGNNFSVTLGGNRDLANPSNLTAGQTGSIYVTQDGTGSRTLSYGTYWDFAGGAAPTLTTSAAAVDRIDYIVRTTTSIHAVATLAYS